MGGAAAGLWLEAVMRTLHCRRICRDHSKPVRHPEPRGARNMQGKATHGLQVACCFVLAAAAPAFKGPPVRA